MKVRLRRVVYWSGAVLAGLVIACYAVLSTMAFDDLVALLKDEVKAATGRDLIVAGPIDLQLSLRPSVDLQDVRFANAGWGSRADMVTIRRLQVEVDLLPLLTGDIIVNRLVLEAPDILLETNAEGTGNWEFQASGAGEEDGEGAVQTGQPSGPPAGEDDAIVLPDVQAFAVRGGRLTLQGADPGRVLRVDLTEAQGLVPEGDGTRSLTMEGRYNDSPFRIEGTFGNLRDILSGVASPLDLVVQAGGAELGIRGTAGDLVGAAAAQLAVTAQGDSLAGLGPFAGSALPDLGPYELSSDINITGELFDFSGLTARIGGSDLAGAATLDLAGKRPSLTADLVAKTLRLADFSAPSPPPGQSSPEAAKASAQGASGEETAGPPPAARNGRLFSEDPLPLEGLSAVDGKVSLTAGAVRVTPRLALQDVKLTAALNDGALRVEPITGGLAGGAVSGRAGLQVTGSLTESPPSVDVVLKGEEIDLGRLLREVEVSDEVRGAVELDLALFSRGSSLRNWAAGLNGHVQAVSLDGTIDNALLGFVSTGLSDITGPLFGSADTASVKCMVGRFDIADGQARSRALVIDAGTFAVTGRGGIDLDAERVNLGFDTETSEPSLASLAVPFKVVGPIAQPAVVPDPVGVAGNLVGTVGNVAKAGGNVAAEAVNTLGNLVGTGPLVGRIGSGQTLCAAAMAAVGEAGAVAPAGAGSSTKPGAKPAEKSLVDDVKDATKEVGDSIEKGLRRLFGN